MNLNDNPTLDQLADLFRGCDDSAGYHVLWVNPAGEVRIDPVAGEGPASRILQAHSDVQLYLREFAPGHDQIGPGAAADVGWVEDVYRALVEAWPRARANGVVAVEDW